MIIRSLLEVTLETSVLIGVIALIRKCFRKYMSPNLVYLLWVFVLVSILVPIGFKFEIRVPKKTETMENSYVNDIEEPMNAGANPFLPGELYNVGSPNPVNEGFRGDISDLNSGGNKLFRFTEAISSLKEAERVILIRNILFAVWAAGVVCFAVFILIANLKLYFYARKTRRRYEKRQGKLPIYSLLKYNCLMGLFRPTIYVDAEGLAEEDLIEEVIRHEYAHFHAGDHVWQFLRTVCLILQWFNPFVWWAYYASRQDGELACDARVIRNYSDEEKFYYAESILRVLEESKRNKREILMVTSMGETKKRVKERIEAVMKREKKPARAIAIILAVIVGVICFFGMSRLGVIEKTLANDTIPEQGAEASSKDSSVPFGSKVRETEKKIHKVDIKEQYTTDIAVASNYYHIDENHVLWGCGQNHYGQLGQGTQDYDFHGEMVKIAENVVHVDYSQSGFAIFLTEEGRLYGIGTSGTGALQEFDNITKEYIWNAGQYYVAEPKLLMENVVYAKCGRYDVVCLLEDGSVWNWGLVWADYMFFDWEEEAGEAYFLAKPVKILDNAIFVTGGFFNHAALLEDGSVWTWGYNLTGCCGVRDVRMVSQPAKVAENVQMVWTESTDNIVLDIGKDEDFEGIPNRYYRNTVLLKDDGTYWCCGAGYGEVHHVSHYYEAEESDEVFSYEFVQIPDKNPQSALQSFGNFPGLGYGWFYYSLPEKEGEDYKICFMEFREEENGNRRFEDILKDPEPEYVFPFMREKNEAIGRIEEIRGPEFYVGRNKENIIVIEAAYDVNGEKYIDTRVYVMDEDGYGYRLDGAASRTERGESENG